MAAKGLLTCLEKRELLNESVTSVDKLLDWGHRYEEEGLIYDALDFYEKAGAREDLTRLLPKAVEHGNLFLFNRLCRILRYEPAVEEWLSLGGTAEENGMFAFAKEAYRRGGRETAAPPSVSA